MTLELWIYILDFDFCNKIFGYCYYCLCSFCVSSIRSTRPEQRLDGVFSSNASSIHVCVWILDISQPQTMRFCIWVYSFIAHSHIHSTSICIWCMVEISFLFLHSTSSVFCLLFPFIQIPCPPQTTSLRIWTAHEIHLEKDHGCPRRGERQPLQPVGIWDSRAWLQVNCKFKIQTKYF